MGSFSAIRDSKPALEAAGCSLAQFLSHSDCRVECIVVRDGYVDGLTLNRMYINVIWGGSGLYVDLKSLPELEQRSIRNSSYVPPDMLSRLCDGLVSNGTLEDLDILGVRLKDAAHHDDLVAVLPPALKIMHAEFEGNESLRSISLGAVDPAFSPCSLGPNVLVSALSHENCKIETLNIMWCSELSRDVLTSMATCVGKTNKSLRNLSICLGISSADGSARLSDEWFSSMLRCNTTLVKLTIASDLDDSKIIQLFKSLEDNSTLEELILVRRPWNRFSVEFEKEIIPHVLDSLQVNGILRRLIFNQRFGLSPHTKAAIEAQLARNREVGEHIKKLKKSQPTERVPPTNSRMFICGEPYAGKSMLAKSLQKIAQRGRKYATNCTCLVLDKMFLKRTRGIEITSLSKDNLKISVWDLAGEHEFHSFHDYMFPDLSSQACPSFFVFVWNPFEVNMHGVLGMRKSRQKFHSEFKYWLKFIASKTRRSKVLKPRLIPVISRKDLIPPHEGSLELWLGDSLTSIQRSFNAIIDVERIFEVDARDPSSVESVYFRIFDTADKVLRSPVYAGCEQVRTLLSDTVRQMKNILPLITFNKFKRFCKQLGIEDDMHEAVALSLHDCGHLIYFKRMDIVVVDTHWFCHRVMGNLIYYSGPGRGSDPLRPTGNTEHGFLSLEYLKSLLEREAKSTSDDGIFSFNWEKRRELVVKGGDLVKLLLELHVACRKDDDREDSEIFIPACLPASDNLQSRWRQDIGDDKEKSVVFVGRRLQCRDSDLTFITPGVFHLLQVALYKDFAANVYPEKNSMSLIFEGVEVLVEFCSGGGEDPFIDILVRSHLDFDTTLKKVHERVIDETIQMCAEPSGIQGVELVEAVVRPSCVRGPSSVDERRKQDVPIEDLHKQLEREVQRVTPTKLSSIMHSWKFTDRLPSTNDRVIDLLGEVEVRKWSEYYERQLRSALGILKDEDAEEAGLGVSERPSFEPTPSGRGQELIFTEMCRQHEEVKREFKEMRRTLEDITGSIEGLHKQVVLRLKELGTFLKAGEDGRVPRMMVVTEEKEGWGRKVISALLPDLHQVRLELLCEHRQSHLVDGQPGLCFATLDDGLLKKALPYANTFLKLANLATGATAHVTLGLGIAIPDFTKVFALLADESDIPLLPQLDRPAARHNVHEAKQWLFDVLSKRNCLQGAKIYETFRLRRVRYPDSQEVAWLCDNHYSDDIAYPA